MPTSGAIQIKGKAANWLMYPCSADEVPLSGSEYEQALEQWLSSLKSTAKEARAQQENAARDSVLQQLWVELEDEDDWKPYYCVLNVVHGLAFYEDKEDSVHNADEPVLELPLDQMKSASRAPGIDFYDGVIDVEVHNGEAMWRIRPSSHAAMHNLLSAINIYKVAPPPPDLKPEPGKKGQLTARPGSAPPSGATTGRGQTAGPGQTTSRAQTAGPGQTTSRGGGSTNRGGGSTNRPSSAPAGKERKLSTMGNLTSRLFGRNKTGDMTVGSVEEEGATTKRGGRKASGRPNTALPLGGIRESSADVGDGGGSRRSFFGGRKSSRKPDNGGGGTRRQSGFFARAIGNLTNRGR